MISWFGVRGDQEDHFQCVSGIPALLSPGCSSSTFRRQTVSLSLSVESLVVLEALCSST